METVDKTLQAIFDQAAVGIAQIGLDGSWLRVNDRYCQMLGYSEWELRTKTICEITHPDDYDKILAARGQLLEGTISSHSMEKRYIRKDGTVFWGRLNRSLVRNQNNQPQFFIAVVEDITEKIQAERALRRSEQRPRAGHRARGVGLWDHGSARMDSRIPALYAAILRAWRRHLRSRGGVGTLVHPDDRERVQALVRGSSQPVAGTGTLNFVCVARRKRTLAALERYGAPRCDDGRPVRMVGVSSRYHRAEAHREALRQSEETARAGLLPSTLTVATQLDKDLRNGDLYDANLDRRARFCTPISASRCSIRSAEPTESFAPGPSVVRPKAAERPRSGTVDARITLGEA